MFSNYLYFGAKGRRGSLFLLQFRVVFCLCIPSSYTYVSTWAQGYLCFKTFWWLLTEAIGDAVSSAPQVLLSAACVSAAVPVAGSANRSSSLCCCPNLCAGAASGTAKAIWVMSRLTASPFAQEGRRKAFPRSFPVGQGTSGVGSRAGDPACCCWVGLLHQHLLTGLHRQLVP